MNRNIENESRTLDGSTTGGRINKARVVKTKMTQKQLARAVNISEPKMSKIVHNRSNVSPEDIKKFAEVLGVSEAYLEGKAETMDTPTALVSEFETQFSKVTTTDKYLPPKEVYEIEDFARAVTLGGKYLVLESSTGIFDLAMAIAETNENGELTKEEQKDRIEKAKKAFTETKSMGETKTYLVLTPEQLDEIVERLTKETIRLRRVITLFKADDEEKASPLQD